MADLSDGSYHDSGDTLAGGNGQDNFVFAAHFGENSITNFHSHKDTIEVSNSEFADLSAVLAANVRIAATRLFHMAMMSSHWKVLI